MLQRLFGRIEPVVTCSSPPEVADGGPTSAAVYHDAARHFLDLQLNTLDELGGKTAQFLSVASLALPITYAFLRPAADSQPLPREVQWLLGGALSAYVLVLTFAAASSMIRALEYRPNITTLKEHSENYPGIALMQWVANEYEASIVENRKVLVRKARLVGAEALCFFVEGLCLSTAVVFLL